MSEPEPTKDSPGGSPPPPGSPPADGVPHLLTMPTVAGMPPAIRWPGREGEPGWAIPVQIPDGTLGYAIFLPLVPAGDVTPVAVPPAVAPADHADGNATAPPGDQPAGGPAPGASAPGVSAPGVSAATASGGSVVGEQARSVTVPAPRTAATPTGSTPTAATTADGTTADGTTADGAPTPPTSTVGDPQPGTGQPATPATSGPTPSGTGQPATPATSGPTPSGAGQPATAGGGTATPGAAGQPATPRTGGTATPGPDRPGVGQPATPGTGGTATAGPGWPGTPGPAAGGRPAPHWGGPPTGWHPTSPPPSFLSTRWPGPRPATGWAVPAGVLAGALGVAFFVPLSRTGIGWFLGWLILTVGVVAAVRRSTGTLTRTDRLIRGGWAAGALALLAVLAFRNAWWLVTFCVLGALGCATLAIVGGRQVRSILFSLVAAPFAALRGLPWVRRHVSTTGSGQLVPRVVGSVAATAVVLLVFGLLLSSADAAFDQVLGAIVPEINAGTVFRWLFLAVVGGLIAVAATYTLAAPPDLSTVDREGRRHWGTLEWAPAIAALTLLFVGFVAVQFTVLFGGQRHVLRTAGLSYAEYARSGFWQLTVVTLLTVAVLGGVSRWARRETRVERVLLRVLLGLISALSVVIVVSALSRMYTYQKVYSFTGERIFVMAFELLLGAVFLMILVAGVRWRGRWIPGVTVGLAVVMLLSLAVLNPEDYAARRNIARYEQTGKIDAWYLRALSADATPALANLPDRVRRCTLSWIDDDLAEPDPWYAWNLGRSRARAELDRLGPRAIGGQKDCKAADQFDLPKTRRTPR
ncbi:DUF4153 domain-containing protein [Micromonospora sp. RL09-050-HVF-A]|uniref:DUF4153 domain-containing protein n=1 Tax=Micromonospora sp. RL09-050-HVF-A TaxID=1703433 RepID=UPI0027E227F7|nr:DUF4153 domain-containing protein [Micromonospora sp. RL09-050-HVF-A]